jgi:hypothetical protein
MEWEPMMHLNEPATMLSVLVAEIEAAGLTGEPSGLTENSVALPSYQFAIAFAPKAGRRRASSSGRSGMTRAHSPGLLCVSPAGITRKCASMTVCPTPATLAKKPEDSSC